MSSKPFKLVLEVDRDTLIKGMQSAKKESVKSTKKIQSEIDDLTSLIEGKTIKAFEKQADAAKSVGDQTSKSARKSRGSAQRMVIGLDGILESFQEIGSVAQGVFDSMINASPQAAVAMSQIKFQTTLISREFGDALAPILKSVVGIFRTLTGVVRSLPEPVKAVIGVVVGLIVVMTQLSGIVVALSAVSGTLILAILAIAAAVALLAVAWKNDWGGIRDTTMRIIEILKPAFSDFFSGIFESFSAMFSRLAPLFEEFGETLMDMALQFVEFYHLVSPIIDILIQIFFIVFEKRLKDLLALWTFVFDTIGNLISAFTKLLKGDFSGAWDDIKAIFTNSIDFIKTRINNWIDAVLSIFDVFGIDLIDVLKEPWNDFKDFLKGIPDFFSDLIDDLIGKAKSGASIMVDFVKTILNSFIDVLNTLLVDPVNEIFNLAANIVDKIPGVSKPDWSIPEIPSFHSGGQFRAPSGQSEGLVLAQDREFFLQPEQLISMIGMGATAGNTVNNRTSQNRTIVNIYNPTFRNRRDLDELADKLNKRDYRNLRQQTFTRS